MTELASFSVDLGMSFVQMLNGLVMGAGFKLTDQWVAGVRGERIVNSMAMGVNAPAFGQVAGATTSHFELLVPVVGGVLVTMYLLLFWRLLNNNYKTST